MNPRDRRLRSDWQVVRGDDGESRRRRSAAVGVVSLVAALLLVTGVVDGGWLGGPTVAVVSTVGFGVLAVWAVSVLYRTVSDGDETQGRLTLPAPREPASPEDMVGATFDRQAGVRPDADPVQGWRAVDPENELRALAVDLLRAERGHDVDGAREAIESGAWTDDPRAAAYLAGTVSLPLPIRVRDWLAGERERRGIAATLAELRAMSDGDGDAAEAADERPVLEVTAYE